jgi:molecular chaperone GrpE
MQDQTATPDPSSDKVHGDKLEQVLAGEHAPGGDAEPDIADRLKRAEAEIAELKDAWLRARADVENVRRQSAESVARAHKFAVEKFAEDLLPVRDALEQSLAVPNATPEQLRAGVELTLRQIDSAFGRAQLVEIDPAGEKFDPHRHQAMQLVESDQPANTVVQVMQKGYALNDRVLRPALVTVAKS